MGERIIISDGGGIGAYACPSMAPAASCAIAGAGALCASGTHVFAASPGEQAIWRLERATLTPVGMFAGGPGMAQLALSRDGERLYALCSEADSLLMMSARTGAPMIVNRVGVGPCAMTMDESGDTIAVAGGACGEVLLLSAHSLSLLGRMPTGGMVFSAAITSGAVYALSLSETLDAVLTAFLPGGIRREIALCGMPGALALGQGHITAATHKAIYSIGLDLGICGQMSAPGRAGRLLLRPWGMALVDTWSDALFIRRREEPYWRRAAQDVRDALIL